MKIKAQYTEMCGVFLRKKCVGVYLWKKRISQINDQSSTKKLKREKTGNKSRAIKK